MSDQARTMIVFVDTSYLSRKPADQEADWNKLLRLSHEHKMEINISHIAIEEYRTQTRDNLIAKIEKAKDALANLNRAWNSNLNLSKELGKFIQPDNFPSPEEVEAASQKLIGEFISNNLIKIIKPELSHMESVWLKYFSWASPFRFCHFKTRDDRATRDSRRKDIPDAWIYEAALDVSSDKTRVMCLCKDDNLTSALQKKGIETVKDAKDILNIIETPPAPIAEPTATTPSSPDEGRVTVISELDQRLLNLAVNEKELQVRVLGYTQWFAPLLKDDLKNMLQAKGYTIEFIENAAQRLALNGLLKDTGNHYIPGNQIICEQAKNSVMEEILEMMDGADNEE